MMGMLIIGLGIGLLVGLYGVDVLVWLLAKHEGDDERAD